MFCLQFKVGRLFSLADCQNLFGIIYRCPQEMKEKLLMFRLVGEEINKQEWLQKLTVGLANTACMADTVSNKASLAYLSLCGKDMNEDGS